jgi:pimeloyl-ACP methyl ester carboxylesterase
MRLLRTPWGAGLLAVLLLVAALFGAAAARVYAKTHPEPVSAQPIDFESMNVRVEAVEFRSADDVALSGWLLRVDPDAPAVVLCHDLGHSRASLINTALVLREGGFNVLMFDFRGHGESGGSGSTLGLLEKRDVIGAVEYLQDRAGFKGSRIGLFGVGMGAHAAVLAAADLAEVRVLVLDSLYPDPAFALVRDVYAEWDFAERNLAFVPRALFAVIHGAGAREQRAEDVIGRLPGRHLLLLAPAGDSALAQAMERMYATIPDEGDADGNLVVLPATQAGALYGDQLGRYHERVAGFFTARLDS